MEVYKELVKNGYVIHTTDIRLRCDSAELKAIGDRVFSHTPLKASEQKIKIESELSKKPA
jgi:hypothetical protein